MLYRTCHVPEHAISQDRMATEYDETAKAPTGSQDSLPEWSKGVDASSTSVSCVGSNPTGVMSFGTVQRESLCGTAATSWESTSVDESAGVCPPQAP